MGILSSWPWDPSRGSGTATALRGLERGLERLGHRVVRMRPAGGGRTSLTARIGFNVDVAARGHGGHDLDLLVGVDLDGFLVRPKVPYVVTLKGVAADEARHESGPAALGLRVAALLEARNARRAGRVVVPSRYAARMARRFYGIPAERLAVVPEPVDRRSRDGDSGHPPRSDPTVLSVARQYPRKRTDLLLRALPHLAHRVPTVRLRIVGDGPELPRLRRLASSLRIGARVTFLGRVTDRALAEEYARADCFALPSEQEAYGIAAVEAMAAGLPVVAARAGATPEVVDDGVTGLLIEPGDVTALTDALTRVLSNPSLRRRMGRAGRRLAARRTPEEHARGFLWATLEVPKKGTDRPSRASERAGRHVPTVQSMVDPPGESQ